MKIKGIEFPAVVCVLVLAAGTVWAGIGEQDGHSNESTNVTTSMTYHGPDSGNPYYVGYTGTNNTLTIEDGARWQAGNWGGLAVGGGAGGDYNTAIIQSGGEYTNTSGIGALQVGADRSGDSSAGGAHNRLLVAGEAYAATARMAGTNNLFRVHDGGFVHVYDTGNLAPHLFVDIYANGLSNRFEVTGQDSLVTVDDQVRIGYGADSRHSVLHVSSNATMDTGGHVYVSEGTDSRYSTLRVSSDATLNIGDRLWLGADSSSSSGAVEVTDGGVINVSSLSYVWRGTGHRLEVSGAGSRINMGSSFYFGNDSGTVSNLVAVGDGGVLDISGTLYLGRHGGYNEVEIHGGGGLEASGNVIMGTESGSEHNTATVSGPGSTLTVGSTLFVGDGGGHNTVTVENSGTVNAAVMSIGSSGTDYNTVTVSGPGSTLALGADGDNYVGLSGSHNTLMIEDGAVVEAGDVDRFWIGSSPGAGGNSVLVDGAGSGLYAANVRVGHRGDNSLLRVTGGGYAEIFGETHVGLADETATGNRLEVAGAGSEALLHSELRMGMGFDGSTGIGDSAVRVQTGGLLRVSSGTSVGEETGGHLLEVTGPGAEARLNGLILGTGSLGRSNLVRIAAGGNLLNEGGLTVGDDGSYNHLLVTGATVTNLGALTVGENSVENLLEVSDGGRLHSEGAAYIGRSGDGNTATVTGSGSLLSLIGTGAPGNVYDGRLTLGFSGSASNLLTVSDGAMVTNTSPDNTSGGIWIGGGTDSDYNSVHVDGAGSEVYAAGMRLGSRGSHSLLQVTDGGYMEVGTEATSLMGWHSSSESNRLEIVGAGSTLKMLSGMSVGWNSDSGGVEGHGGGQAIEVLDGGLLDVDGHLKLGNSTAATRGNRMLVDGAAARVGSTWSVGGEALSHSNTLTASNGAYLQADSTLNVGAEGSYNELRLESASTAMSAEVVIGASSGSVHNLMTVTGAGSVWTNTGTIYVSAAGEAGNRLEIRDGGEVESADTIVRAGGTLLMESTTGLDSFLTIEDGGALEGEGIILKSVDSAGRIAPGQSAGELEIWGNLTLQETSVLEMELGGTAAGEYDRVSSLNYTIAFDGTLSVALIGGYDPQDGDTFTLFDNWDLANSSGSFAVYDLPDLGAGLGWDRSELESEGTLTVIPEPSTGLLLAAILGLAALRRRRQRQLF